MVAGSSSKAARGLTALLDIGSYKIACAIAEAGPHGRILARTSVRSAGVRAGDIRQPLAAHGAIVKAISEAEQLAGASADSALVAIAAGRPAALHLAADVALNPPVVTPADASRLKSGMLAHAETGGRIIIHVEEPVYRLDGRATSTPPLDRFGRLLDMSLTVVTVDEAPLRRLLEAIDSTNLPVAGVVPAGLASGLAVTTALQRDNGAAMIDIGAEQTTIATFSGAHLTSLDTVALGLRQVAADVAQALQINDLEAERIISEYGIDGIAHAVLPDAALRPAVSDHASSMPHGYAPMSAGTDARAAHISGIAPRLDTLLRLVADRLDARQACLRQSSHVVLTGGASTVPGLAAHAAHVWGRSVMIGQPLEFAGVSSPAASADAAVLAGLAVAHRSVAYGVRFQRSVRSRQVA